MSTGMCVQVFGPDWVPMQQEHANMVLYTGKYLESKGLGDIPPGWLLAFVVAGYALPRLGRPTTVGKLRGWFRRGRGQQ